MCGIIGGVSARADVTPALLEGLRRLEYRGYDSAGLAVVPSGGGLTRRRTVGKVHVLAALVAQDPVNGSTGIAHTRWATHGAPRTDNAHPHVSGDVAVVHNGIVENHENLRAELTACGYRFESETDTEVIAHLLHSYIAQGADLREAVTRCVTRLEGAYTFAAVRGAEPERLVAARRGSPLVLGTGDGHCYLASDLFALAPVAEQVAYIEDGDIVDLRGAEFTVFAQGVPVSRPLREMQSFGAQADKGGYAHYMLKEIHEQPAVVARTLEEWLEGDGLCMERFSRDARELLARVRAVHIVACGTSYHAGLVARHWIEGLGIPCHVEVASEYRYRPQVVLPDTLLITVSQSGETADTLAALRETAGKGYLASLTVCNVATSSLVRESNLAMLTRAGQEIGVASTKAFTAQLTALSVLTLALAREKGRPREQEQAWVSALRALPARLESLLSANAGLPELAADLATRSHALYLGRNVQYPVALEGALKLKEISYLHAEAYPAGELKHGPLALVDSDMPVICTLPHDALAPKVLSNLKEVQARGGQVIVFADDRVAPSTENYRVLRIGHVPAQVAPIMFTAPLQLLAYHTAVVKGADVDQPRNLAKSVTVE